MLKKLTKSSTLTCFSPPVMLATFFIEIGLVIYTLAFRKMNPKVLLGVLLLICLAIFQLAEYSICESFGIHPDNWAKIGFAAITMLPPLGLHLVYTIAGKKSNLLLKAAYAFAALWVGIFVFGNVMSGSVCEGNYVIFHISEPAETLYYWYYDLLMLTAMWIGLRLARKEKKKAIRSALRLLVAAYAAFIIPSMIFAKIANHQGESSPLPSILCGFAIILAVALSFGVLPKVSKKK